MKLKTPRLIGIVDLSKAPVKRTVLHMIGSPEGHSSMMADAAFVVVSEDRNGNFLTDRYSRDGLAAGDTWHRTLDEARSFLAREFGDGLGELTPVAEGEDDVRALGVRMIGNRK